MWACRRVDVRRRLERRQSCDRCSVFQRTEEISSRGSDIEPMPSRAYHKLSDGHLRISPTSTSPTAVSPCDDIKTPPIPPTAALTPSFTSSAFTETIPIPPSMGARYDELDVEQRHLTYTPSSPRGLRYRFDDSEDDEPHPPTPLPKPQYRERVDRSPLPKIDVRPNETSKGREWRNDEARLGAPSRAYSVSSYYYSHHGDF